MLLPPGATEQHGPSANARLPAMNETTEVEESEVEDDEIEDLLVREITIDGMCGVY